MGTAALDTNVLLRLVVPDLPTHHERARRLLARPGAKYLVSDYAFVELVFALDRHYGLTRDQIATVVQTIISLDNISCQTDQLASAVQFWKTHPKLSFEDCLMAEHAETNGALPLWTFDRKLARHHLAAEEVPEQ